MLPTTSPPDEHSIGSSGPPASTSIDDAEFESLLVSVLEPAYRLAYRLANDSQDAEDLVQEAALRAFRFRHSFQRGTSFKAWFYRIVMNQFYTSTRRRKGTTTSSLDSLTDAHEILMFVRSAEAGLLRPDTDPAATVVARMAEDDVARALATLPDEFRTVATLYFVDDLSYQEIAEVLEVPIGTVRSRLHRGRQMLQKQLWRVAEELGIVQPSALAGDT